MTPLSPPLDRAVHYVISHSRPEELGKTKLNKVLWRADVEHYRRHGTTVTRLENYRRMQYGPVPHTITQSLGRLSNAGKISIAEELYEFAVHELQALEVIGPEDFSSSEIECLQEAIRHVSRLTAGSASNETHDALWEEIGLGADISVGAASIKFLDLNPEDFDWAMQLEAS
jgi:hypothetical protein